MSKVELTEPAPHTGLITLNDPENLNAMGEEMAAEFSALVKSLRGTPKRFRALMLTGAGRAFSAGGNLAMLEAKTKIPNDENRRLMLEFYRSFLGILDVGVPIIAVLNGPAIGAGLCVASACDIRIAADGAKLGFTFTKLGLHPGMGATYFLPRVLGYPAAVELMLTGRVIEAKEALAIGLVSRVVAAESLIDEAKKIAAEIGSCGPDSIRQLLHTLRGDKTSLEAALEHEAACQSENYAGGEFKEGVRAMREKRPALFA